MLETQFIKIYQAIVSKNIIPEKKLPGSIFEYVLQDPASFVLKQKYLFM